MVARIANGQWREDGIALLALLLLVVMIGTSLVLATANRTRAGIERHAKTVALLMQAKDALVARAVTDNNRPGSLPCPDITGDGTAPSPFIYPDNRCPSRVGWLPWRTLDLPDIRDASGERFWYVLNQRLRDDSTAQPINSTPLTVPLNPTLDFTLDGASGIAALIIAPGPALGTQRRPSNAPADYLDGSNADGDNSFVSGPSSDAFNDRVIAIDTATLFSAVAPRILNEMRAAFVCAVGNALDADSDGDGLSNPGVSSGRYPYKEASCSAKLPSPDFILSNGWYALVAYNRVAKTLSLNGHTIVSP